MNRRHFCTAMGAMSLALAVGPDAAAGQVHNVRSYGARGDGSTIDSPAINRAIEAAAAKGGVVYFPAGTYASYSVRLKSRITIYLDRGATLLGASGGYDASGTGAGNDYQDFGHSHWRASLIWGEDLSDIKIIGPGRIDGSGLVPRMEANSPAGTGDKAIALKLCRDVRIEGVTIVAGGHIAILATGVDHLTIDNVTIDTIRDGINVDCGRNIRITNTTVNSFNNDGICLKSSYALGHARATKNVTITNCRVSGYDVGTLVAGTYKRENPRSWDGDGPFGRVKFGTESNGGFENVVIKGVTFERCRGIALETVDGGNLEDIEISDITMRDVTSAPIFLRLGARMRGPSGVKVGKLRRVRISNLVATGADPRYASIITGIPGHRITDVRLRDIRLTYQGGLSLVEAGKQPPELLNKFFAQPGAREPYDVPERPEAPPEPAMFGVLPAYGFYIRHAKDVRMHNVHMGFTKPDLRPPFVLDDVEDSQFHAIKADRAQGVPMFVRRAESQAPPA